MFLSVNSRKGVGGGKGERGAEVSDLSHVQLHCSVPLPPSSKVGPGRARRPPPVSPATVAENEFPDEGRRRGRNPASGGCSSLAARVFPRTWPVDGGRKGGLRGRMDIVSLEKRSEASWKQKHVRFLISLSLCLSLSLIMFRLFLS